jgi:hypothetical protein
MIKINGFENKFILDLNVNPVDEHEFTVISKNGNEELSWGVELVSLNEISVMKHSGNKLSINLDVNTLNKDGFILLRNYNKERLVVEIIHNEELSREKEYTFKFENEKVEGKKITIDILSQEESKEMSWACTYDGRPLKYSISPKRSDKSEKVEIVLLSPVSNEFKSIIEFTQDKSDKIIKLKLTQNRDNITIKTD